MDDNSVIYNQKSLKIMETKIEEKKIEEIFLSELCEKFNVNYDRLSQLQKIGGQKQYHREGDALRHTYLVVLNAMAFFGSDQLMIKIALLHDVGKIHTGVQKPDGDWGYPNHSGVGAEKLGEFYSPTNSDFATVKWYVKNHIKPMFWHWDDGNLLREEIAKVMKTAPNEDCTISNLCGLVLCDITGSHGADPLENSRLEMGLYHLFTSGC